MGVNTLLKVLEQLLHKIKANRRREMVGSVTRKAEQGEVLEHMHLSLPQILDAKLDPVEYKWTGC